MNWKPMFIVVLVAGLGFTSLGCEFAFSYKSISAPLGTWGEVAIRVTKTHAKCTLPNPYDYQLTASGVQILGETPWTDVQANVIEKWVLISLAETGDGYLKVSKTCSKEGYEEGVLPIGVAAPAADGVWINAWNGTYPFDPPAGYTVLSVAGEATIKGTTLTVGTISLTLPTTPPTLLRQTLPVRLYYVTKDGKLFPLLIVGEGLFWRYDPLLKVQG